MMLVSKNVLTCNTFVLGGDRSAKSTCVAPSVVSIDFRRPRVHVVPQRKGERLRPTPNRLTRVAMSPTLKSSFEDSGVIVDMVV